MIHARHATFYLLYARFPNIYLRDLARYGADYKTKARNPVEITIQQSRAYRMRYPAQQAEFFRLIANLLFYMASGLSKIGFLEKDEWNPYYQVRYGLQVCPRP